MASLVIQRDDRYVLNYCAKHLARERGPISDAWRFPIIDRCLHRASGAAAAAANTPGDAEPPPPAAGGLPPAQATPSRRSWAEDVVTFVWDGRGNGANNIAVTGSMTAGQEPIPLRNVQFDGQPTGYFAVSLTVARGTIHTYLFVIDGELRPDPINPQRTRTSNGTEWSRFFTTGCMQPLVLQRWEFTLLERLCDHILPFRTRAGERFLGQFYYTLDRSLRNSAVPLAYKIDQSVGVANYIDCILAREEAHRLLDYRICLAQISKILRELHPQRPLAEVPRETFVELYEAMARNQVDGWDYQTYQDPRFFLKLLRRHAVTGAFSHPDYGGNTGGAAWAFLSERYVNDAGQTLFDFGSALETGLGRSAVYYG